MKLVSNEKILSERVVSFDDSLTPELPIFYLTTGGTKLNSSEERLSADSIRRDIISLWQSTNERYDFIWQRIAEIEIKESDNDISVNMFATNIRAKLLIKTAISAKLLARIWSVFYFIEKKNQATVPTFWTTIELNDDNAIIKDGAK